MKTVLPLAIIFLALAGCGTHRQLQAIADAREGAKAVLATPSPEGKAPIADALAKIIIASTETIPNLPAPTEKAPAITAQPATFIADADKLEQSPPVYEPPTAPKRDIVREELERYGVYAMRTGAIILGACALIFLIGFWPLAAPYVVLLRPFLAEGVVLGTASLSGGAAMAWLSTHTWVIYLTGAFLLALVAVRYRYIWLPILQHAFDVKRPKSTVAPKPPVIENPPCPTPPTNP